MATNDRDRQSGHDNILLDNANSNRQKYMIVIWDRPLNRLLHSTESTNLFNFIEVFVSLVHKYFFWKKPKKTRWQNATIWLVSATVDGGVRGGRVPVVGPLAQYAGPWRRRRVDAVGRRRRRRLRLRQHVAAGRLTHGGGGGVRQADRHGDGQVSRWPRACAHKQPTRSTATP